MGSKENKSRDLKEQKNIKQTISESNLQHIAINKLLIVFAFTGSLLMILGESFGPDDCENVTIFESLGNIIFWISLVGGFAVNLLILSISLSDDDFSSLTVLGWTVLHFFCWLVAAMIASDAIISNMWCGGGGPSYDIGAGF